MKLIIGLGNPGKEYAKSRHNIGFMVLDALNKELKLDHFIENKKFHAEITEGNLGKEKFILAKPLTYMNLSGNAASKISQFYKIDPTDVIVLFDDLDLPIGKIRIRKSGSPGTHNGVKSLVEAIGQNFPRIRIGIEGRGETLKKQQDAASYVLSPFIKADLPAINQAINDAVSAVKLILKGDFDLAMNSFN